MRVLGISVKIHSLISRRGTNNEHDSTCSSNIAQYA